MKRAASAIRTAASAVARAVGLEGAFLIAGTALIAAAGAYLHPAVPLLVVGVMCTLAGLALAMPRRSS